MNDRISGVAGMVGVAGLAIVCCAGPLLVTAAVSLGLGAWLAAHGLWLLGGLGVLVAGVAMIAALRRRRAATCAVDERGATATLAARRPGPREVGRS
jgi:hypothetical protein